jgi:hypothetical protein
MSNNPTTTHPTTESVPVRVLQVGDNVVAHGMLLEIIETPHRSLSHGDKHGGCWVTLAKVLNADAVISSGQVPEGWMTAERNPIGVTHAWSLQCNDLGSVARIVEDVPTNCYEVTRYESTPTGKLKRSGGCPIVIDRTLFDRKTDAESFQWHNLPAALESVTRTV